MHNQHRPLFKDSHHRHAMQPQVDAVQTRAGAHQPANPLTLSLGNRFMKIWKSTQTAFMTLMLCIGLAACGGGGGSAGTNGAGTGGSAAKVPTLSVNLRTAAGDPTLNISIGGGQTVKATVTDAAGSPIVGKLVVFSVEPSNLASLSPSSALTDSNGVASVSISPASVSMQGAGQIEAQATVGEAQLTGTFDFSVQPVNLSLTGLQLDSNSLPSGGNTSISTSVLIGGQPAVGVPVNVVFTASCGQLNGEDAIKGITVPTDGDAKASVSYRAMSTDGTLCQGRVNLSASTVGASPQSSSLSVAAPLANAINFVSASPAQIFVAGSGAQEQSLVTFKVLSNSSPMAGVTVRFSILVNPGGVGLNATGQTNPVNAITDSKGEATVSVFSGTIPGPVKVRAELTTDSQVFSTTQNLTVASGPPSQRFMSLSVETFNIEGWSYDGSSTRLTVRLADRQGNPVENGTVINFTAEGGQVQPSCATQVVDGISLCSVNFVSQNPRPANARVSVLAYVAGTKDYDDNDQNNKYDEGVDTLRNQGDAYRDDNENGQWDVSEFVVPRGGSSSCTGSGAPYTSKQDTCATGLATTVRQQTTILFSSSEPDIDVTSVNTGGVNFTLGSKFHPSLPMPAGTVVSAEAADSTPGNNVDCTVNKVYGTPVANVTPGTNPAAILRTNHSITLKDCAPGDGVAITIKAPKGLQTTQFVAIPSGTPPPVGDPDNITASAPVPSQIFVKGNGLTEQAALTFQVRSGTTPIANQDVNVSILNNVGGIEFNTKGNTAPVTLRTNSSGQITFAVFSGTIPTPVKIRAELLSNPSVFTETQNLTIASGPPSQQRFSLSASKFALDSGIDGEISRITVYAADRQGNPVPNGTVINFTAEGGQIEPACTITSSPSITSCSVNLVTQSPRPANGRVSVLAYAEGTKAYIDVNGDNTFDTGDTLLNLGNAYRDDNENGVYDPGEFVVTRFGGTNPCPSAGAPFPARINTCTSTLQTTVRQQMNLFFAGPGAEFSITSADATGIGFKLSTFGLPLVPMPTGTTIAATSSKPVCVVGEISPSTVPNVGAGTNPIIDRSTSHFVSLTCTPEANAPATTATITITVTTTASNAPTQTMTTVTVAVPAGPVTP